MSDAYLPPGTRPFTVDELFDLLREGRPAVDLERWAQGWIARLAPIGELDVDGVRMLSAGGQWSVQVGAPVVDLANDRSVGLVLRVWVEEWALMAAGVIDPAVDLAGLSPQVELIRMRTMMGGADQSVTVFLAAEVGAVALGINPAFPSLWIRHDGPQGRAW